MSSMVWLMICFTLSVSSSVIPCSPMLKDASLVLPSYLNKRTFQKQAWDHLLYSSQIKESNSCNCLEWCRHAAVIIRPVHTRLQTRSLFLSLVQWELCRRESLVQRSWETTAGWEWILQMCQWCCTEKADVTWWHAQREQLYELFKYWGKMMMMSYSPNR